MFIDGVPILHAVSKQTHLSRATVLRTQDGMTVWQTFMKIWVCPYFGLNIWVDRAEQIIYGTFALLSNALRSNIAPVAVGTH